MFFPHASNSHFRSLFQASWTTAARMSRSEWWSLWHMWRKAFDSSFCVISLFRGHGGQVKIDVNCHPPFRSNWLFRISCHRSRILQKRDGAEFHRFSDDPLPVHAWIQAVYPRDLSGRVLYLAAALGTCNLFAILTASAKWRQRSSQVNIHRTSWNKVCSGPKPFLEANNHESRTSHSAVGWETAPGPQQYQNLSIWCPFGWNSHRPICA